MLTLPEKQEARAALESQRTLAAFLSNGSEIQQIQIFDQDHQPHAMELPTSALRLLVDILGEIGDGNAVKIVPVHAELTTQEAADLLNVSRPHLVKLLETGKIPFHRAGKHRRIKFSDLMDYKNVRDTESEQALAELAQQAQELDMGYQ